MMSGVLSNEVIIQFIAEAFCSCLEDFVSVQTEIPFNVCTYKTKQGLTTAAVKAMQICSILQQ